MRNATQKRKACTSQQIKLDAEKYESRIGIEYADGIEKHVGYLANVKPTTYTDQNGQDIAALILYFIKENGKWIKAIRPYQPYFFVQCNEEVINEIIFILNKTYEEQLKSIDVIYKEDLALINHLSGKKGKFIKLSFKNVQDLMDVKKQIQDIVEKNKAQKETNDVYDGWKFQKEISDQRNQRNSLTKILEIREYDVAYHIRTMIDCEIRCSFWYDIELDGSILKQFKQMPEKLDKADLRIMAFDIETTKAELKFPDSKFDQIMMISYIVDDQGFLITNRQVVGADVQDFEYSPRPDYDVGKFKIFNEPDEKNLLLKFFQHIRETKPFIFVTFNGDFFDWPFIQDRAEHYQLKMEEEIGIYNSSNGEILGRFTPHLDCFYWVKRDAYLPQGSHGLKAVTKAKLGYDPVELDPELMLPYAQDRPQELAEYSVSDSVATYFLYKKMIHDFIFALSTIIPTYPDEVLRRGSGTLCENLLMAQAFRCNIVFPNKQSEKFERFFEGKLIDTDTYTGGTVECLQQGVYRSDIPVKFKLCYEGFQKLIDETDDIMKFAIMIEGEQKCENVENYDEIKQQIIEKLKSLRDRCPNIEAEPLIYHVDVAAMYPNIILSNRLQPVAIVNEQICAGCIFNKDENRCKRDLDWQWKGEMFPLSKREFEQVKMQFDEDELFNEQNQKNPNKNNPGQKSFYNNNNNTLTYHDKLRQRVKQYCQKVYKTVHVKKDKKMTDTVCMRENPFYVDTVRDFRDRRYEFKRLTKDWQGKLKEAQKNNDSEQIEISKNRMNLFESLQLAHKIILNSFYGYVMKKGARWYSMEMAAMVTYTGGSIITDSRRLIDQIGMPLELDTDGIWTLLPKGFPENYQFKLKNGKKINFDFPCTMCNNLIYDKYGNNQYQTLVKTADNKLLYEIRHEMSVFFEIDGPYRCMIIPSSKEENKMLKKRYAVFNHAGKMTEVKGFELKRRGELKIIKIFQEEVFSKFLEGSTLQECYDACGEVGQRWYDILDSKGAYIDEIDLIEYIGEERVLSKSLKEYGTQKGTSITCANRLAEFLGNEILRDDGGINVKFIITQKPLDAKVADRAVPTSIFSEKQQIKEKYLKKWLKDYSLTNFEVKSLIDWDYYKERLGGSIQKIVTIPAFLQQCMNPIPQIEYPTWLYKKKQAQEDKFKQKDIKSFFQASVNRISDIEDLQKKGAIILQQSLSKNAQANHKNDKNNIPIINDKYSKIEDCPEPINQNFKEWMKYQKQNWRHIRKDFKQKKQIIHFQEDKAFMKNFIKNSDQMILNSNWNIVSIEETLSPGVLKLWVFTQSNQMFDIKLKVPRTVYINSKVQSENSQFKRVMNKILPRNRVAYYLYEWETSEELFLEKFNSISYGYLLNSNIEGIYETKMPIKFRAICELSCQMRPKKNKISIGELAKSRIYSLIELENIHNEGPYLQSGSYKQIWLIQRLIGKLQTFSLFIEFDKQAYIFTVDSNIQKKMTENTEITAIRECFKKTLEECEKEEEFQEWKIISQYGFSNLKEVFKLIEKIVKDKFKDQIKFSTILVVQSDLTNEMLLSNGLYNLLQDYPLIRFPQVDYSNQINHLTWLIDSVKSIFYQFAYSQELLSERIYQSRYACTPLGNLEEDMQISVIDILFARILQLNRCLLWYSNSSLPDLGGQEEQDFRSYYQEEIENPEWIYKGFYRGYTVEIDLKMLSVLTIIQSEFLKEFEQATKAAAHFQNIDKNQRQNNEKMKLFSNTFDTDLDEFVSCQNTFQRLKELIKHLIDDSILRQDPHADKLVGSIYKWLTSPKLSKLYDPLLHRLVQKLMSQRLSQILRRFKQLGCQIVYASFHKIFVFTNKKSLQEAESHISFVLQNLLESEISNLKDIIFQPVEYWRILLFKDLKNYAGFRESNPKDVSYTFDIVNYLPEATQKFFVIIMKEYIIKVYKHNLDLQKKLRNREFQIQENQDGQIKNSPGKKKIESFMDVVDDIERLEDHEFISKLITNHFSQKLFQSVSDFINKKSLDYEIGDDDEDGLQNDDYNSEGVFNDQKEVYWEEDLDYQDNFDNKNSRNNKQSQIQIQENAYIKARKRREQERKQREIKRWDFPQLIGSHYQYVNPALEFSKFICLHLFGVDDSFRHEANQVKANLLRMIHVKEFSSEVQEGIEPSLLLVVPDVICDNCQFCFDLDICRDQILNINTSTISSNLRQNSVDELLWKCQQCECIIKKQEIQRRLVDLVNRRLIQYQMQDLSCIQCKMVKNSIISRYCECTGTYTQTIGNKMPEKLQNQNLLNQMTDIKLFMYLMRNFAKFHGFTILQDCTQQIILIIQ